jgi:C-5 cytosine-specific DNA methylase
MKPIAIDLFCGLGGWTEGLLATGYDVVGFDIERHEYGEHRYPAQLVIQDARSLHGRQFKDVRLIVASPPCQEYSYMAMPWSRAKQIRREYLDGTRDRAQLTELFDTCFRIQREACKAAGRHIPMVVENVRGAQEWVGRSRWSFGSFHLWGDVPALMPMTIRIAKRPGHDWNRFKETGEVSPHWRLNGEDSIKNQGGSWFAISHNNVPHSRGDAIMKNPGARHQRDGHRSTQHLTNPGENGEKQGGDWFREPGISAASSKSSKRKAASAQIAKIPFPLSSHIARVYA